MKKNKGKKNSKFNYYYFRVLFIVILLYIMAISMYFLGTKTTIIFMFLLGIILLFGYWMDRPKQKRKKIITRLCIFLLIIGIFGLSACCYFAYKVIKNAPDFEKELLKKEESTIIYDSDGIEYAKLGNEIRDNITYDEISEVFIDALVATEDSRFFQHNGFDLLRFSKAFIGQVMGNSNAGGGSTLTMQVAKNTYTDASADSGIEGIIRKFTDIYLSIFQIERNYTKEEIIEFYINNHDLSGIICGVQEASIYFFDKDAKDLNLAESSLLAGLYQAPSYYNPYVYPERATKRRSTVLYLMEKHGYITEEERKIAESVPVSGLLSEGSTKKNEYQSYIDLVCEEIKKRYNVDPYSTPMLIYTNMVRSEQKAVDDILAGNNKNVKWTDSKMQSGIAVVNSTSGKIEAIGAGRNRTGAKSYNYATSINRQIGSTAKPLFDYGPGMEYNNWSTYTLFDDSAYTYSTGQKITNYDNEYHGVLTMREALSDSRNIPALKAFQQVDNKKIVALVQKVGIKPEVSPNGTIFEAHAIGSFTGSNPLTMAGAYQIFSNGGYYYEPYAVNKVVFRNTNKVESISSTKVKVISDSTAYMISDILKGVHGSNSYSRKGLTSDYFAIKTGTTNIDAATVKKQGLKSNIRDYWIDGYTHNKVISIWIGFDEISKDHYFKSGDGDLRSKVLNAVAKACFSHDKIDFAMPSSVVKVGIEKLSNPPLLASVSTPKDLVVNELFKKGTEPLDVSMKYIAINNFSVDVIDDTALISWDPVIDDKLDISRFGYYIYFNDEKIAFTSENSYSFKSIDSYNGTYTIKAGYSDNETNLSNPVSYTFE